MITSQKQVYDQWDYGTYNEYKKRLILKELLVKKNQTFLDLGCGCGDFSHFIPKNYKYIGLDFTETQVKKAQQMKINVKSADLSKTFPLKNNSVDVILASEIIEHLFDTDFFLSECRRVLKKNGILILTTPNTCDLSGRIRCVFGRRPPNIEHRTGFGYAGHIRAFTIHDLRELIEDNKLILKKYTGYEFYLPFRLTCNTKYVGNVAKVCGKLMPTLVAGLLLICIKNNTNEES
jgi:ubiquinone/menaquinone biosynthesis C-methylase UbiE